MPPTLHVPARGARVGPTCCPKTISKKMFEHFETNPLRGAWTKRQPTKRTSEKCAEYSRAARHLTTNQALRRLGGEPPENAADPQSPAGGVDPKTKST